MRRGPLGNEGFGGEVAAEQQQAHTALRQRRQQLLGGQDVAAHAGVIGAAVGDGVSHGTAVGLKLLGKSCCRPPEACETAHSAEPLLG